MAIDDVPVQSGQPAESKNSAGGSKTILVVVALAALALGELFTVSRMNTMRTQLSQEQGQLREDISGQLHDQISSKLAAIQQQNSADLDAIRTELDDAAKRVGSQSGELRRARKMVAQLQDQQQTQAAQMKQELDEKADQKQVGALTEDMNSTKSDLSTTKKNVNTLAADLGMARSDMGTLIARNHDDIEYLRKLGDRDYYEFTLTKDKLAKVAGIGLELRKTNVKHYRFNVATLVDDMRVERRDCTVNSPVYFFVNGSRKPYELVVNSVGSNQVKGYLSTPKGVTEVASRSEGAH